MNRTSKARSLALLGMLLQAMHAMFGITAIIGVLIAHVNLAATRETVYYSHLRWQIATFWYALAGYAAAVWLWLEYGTGWPVIIPALFVVYRLLVNLYYWRSQRQIVRIF
ncbi:MAG: hypothetical protein AB8B63_07945 [Granulosicoccus sp.]